MAFVVSEGALRPLDRPATLPPARLQLADDFTADYAEIWRTQPAVRTVVSFLARNIASLGLHAFRRVSDTDRERLTDHPLARLIQKPNPDTTHYRLINSLVHDLGIYDAAYWLKMRTDGGAPALWRLPPDKTAPTGDNWLWPEAFLFRGGRGKQTFPAEQVVYFRGHNPSDPRAGSSPIESLRRTLAEEWEAGRMREQMLRNGARVSGYLERPAGAPDWSPEAKDRFRQQWHAQYTGNGPHAGGTPILEDGMQFKPASQTAEQLQYIEARKLTREEVAGTYFVPPPMIGLLEHATFSNIREQHRMLYQDCLGPWLTMIAEELQLQLLPELAEPDIYVEFNLSEKLRGSFEEQAQAASTATGRPWMTANEQRARFNLPAVDDGDELVVPLNVLVGGQPSPATPTEDPGEPGSTEASRVLEAFFSRQGKAVRSRLGADPDDQWWDGARWDRELTDDLRPFAGKAAHLVATTVNAHTKAQLDAALSSQDPAAAVTAVFDHAAGTRSRSAADLFLT